MTQDAKRPVFRASAESMKTQKAEVNDKEEDNSYFKGKLVLSRNDRLKLELIMASPIFITLGVLYTTHSFLLTLISFHVVLVFLALKFLKAKNVQVRWGALLKRDLQKHPRNLKADIRTMVLPVLGIMSTYVWFRRTFPDFDYHIFRIPSVNDAFVAVLLFIEFVLINPIVEEFFWRIFCDLFTGQGKTFLNKLDVAIHFGLYHWFVAYFLCQNLALSTAGFFGVVALGYALTLIKEKAGFITTMIIHLGVDLAAVIAIWDLQCRVIPLY